MAIKKNEYFSLGLDFGSNSVRALIVDVANGNEIGVGVAVYAHGKMGILLSNDPHLARQNPLDYLTGLTQAINIALKMAKKIRGFTPTKIVGIGVDTTGSTPIPVDKNGNSLAQNKKFGGNINAQAWLWKDHTSVAEAAQITELAQKEYPQYINKCGGIYSSEWYFSKILHCLNVAPKVFENTHSFIELADWVPAQLTNTQHPDLIKVGVCAAGHKAMYNQQWGGYPAREFLYKLNPALAELHDRLPRRVQDISQAVGGLSPQWAKKLGLNVGIPVATGAFDCHLGAVGAGISAGTLVKTIGTSTCDIMVVPENQPLADISGLCGIVKGSVLPNHYGLEAGQSAVGDIYNWWVEVVHNSKNHNSFTIGAEKLKPGQSGLLALDWNNGNRTVLVDQRLSGLMLGQNLHTTKDEIYRALIEATAFGSLTIINRFEEFNVKVDNIIACGGIAEKNPLVMQIHCDIINRPIATTKSTQACALGSAMAGAVVAGVHPNFITAQKMMSAINKKVYKPNPRAVPVYAKLYGLYKTLHDAFGTKQWQGNLYLVMKELLQISSHTKTK